MAATKKNTETEATDETVSIPTEVKGRSTLREQGLSVIDATEPAENDSPADPGEESPDAGAAETAAETWPEEGVPEQDTRPEAGLQPTIREGVLASAKDKMSWEEREYGSYGKRFMVIGQHLEATFDHPVSDSQIAQVMIGFELAKVAANPRDIDAWTAIAEAAALGAEAAHQ